MRFSTIFLGLGWVAAIGAGAAGFTVFQELLDMRAKERLTSVQLPVEAQTTVPEGWGDGRQKVMLVGDSRVRRWTVLPENAAVVFGKSGVGGETVGQLERRFDQNVLGFTPSPDALLIATGVNDLVAASLYARWGEGFQDNVITTLVTRLEGLIDRAEARGMTVSLASIIQAAKPDALRRQVFWDDSLFDLIRKANGQIAALAERRGLTVYDFNAFLDGGTGPLPAGYAADTLHFTPEAYTALNAALLRDYRAK